VLLLVGDQLVQGSVYRLLAEHGDALFGDEYFADLFKRSTLGCPPVPARVARFRLWLIDAGGGADRPPGELQAQEAGELRSQHPRRRRRWHRDVKHRQPMPISGIPLASVQFVGAAQLG
jgi:hypothetical protein